jgi:hypothetical protein
MEKIKPPVGRRKQGVIHAMTAIMLSASLMVAANATAQDAAPDRETVGLPQNMGQGITETIAQIMQREQRIESMSRVAQQIVMHEERDVNRNPAPNPLSPQVSSYSADASKVKTSSPESVEGTVGTNFTADTYNSGPGYVPPDAQGCVGATQIVAIANGYVAVYSKAGVLGGLKTGTDNFFASVLGGSSASDPHVHYDPISQRWFITMINVATVDRIMIAVSSGPTITAMSSFTFFEFEHDKVGTQPNSDTGGFADYDTFGVDGNALYIGANIFGKSGSFIGSTAYVINKANLLAGTLTVTPFRQLCTATGAGPFTPQGVDNDDPTATTGYFIGVDNAKTGQLDVRRISSPGGTPTISGNLIITVPATAIPKNIASLGSVTLDPDDDRLFQATMHINATTGKSTLWCSHHIKVTAAGVGSSSGTRDAVRWYEVANLTTTPTLNQSGTLYDPSTSKLFYTYGTIAENGQGNAEIAATVSGAKTAINSVVAGHSASGAAGSTTAPTSVTTNTGKYTITFDGSPHRWGDYSAVNVDPADNQTLWCFSETCSGGVWGEQATEITAPPLIVEKMSHAVIAETSSEQVQVIGDVTKGAFFESGPYASKHMTVTIGGGVRVISQQVDNSGQITLTVSTKGVAPGKYDITVTNPDGQSNTLKDGFEVATSSVLPSVAASLQATLFPDPAHSQITLSFKGDYQGAMNMIIADATGKVVFQTQMNNFNAATGIKQDISQLSNGMYFITLMSQGGSYFHQVIRFDKN